MLKRIITSDAFRIYFWPIVILWALFAGSLLIALPLEPGSLREKVFVCIGSLFNIRFLWTLVCRYRNIKGYPVGKRAIVLLVILTAILSISMLLIFVFDILPVLIGMTCV